MALDDGLQRKRGKLIGPNLLVWMDQQEVQTIMFTIVVVVFFAQETDISVQRIH